MIFNKLLKVMGGLTLITTTLAQRMIGDCLELKAYFDDLKLYYDDYIDECHVNEKGEIIRIDFWNKEYVETILKHKSVFNTVETILHRYDLSDETCDILDTLPNLKEVILREFEFIEDSSFLNKITSLEISTDYIKGIPDFIFSKSNLKKLALQYVKLKQADIDGIASMKNLDELSLVNCNTKKLNLDNLKNLSNLTGLTLRYSVDEMPSFVESLTNLKKFIFNIDDSTFILPHYLSKLKNLEYLDLSSNFLEEFPKDILDLKSLEHLYLNGNYLIRSIPDEIVNLENLKSLNLEDIEFKTFPEKILELKKLEYLNLNSIGLQSIPDEIGNLKNLNELLLESNDISKLPKQIGDLENLKTLDLSYNRLTDIPEQIGNLKKLQKLDLSDNELVSIPSFLSNLDNLEVLYLDYNKIYSDLPQSFNNLKNLKEINLSGNYNVKGKMLTNESLESCSISVEYDLCIVKKIKCLEYYDEDELKQFDTCSESTEDEKESTNGKCGKEDGKCPSSQCCNKNGECTSDEKQCLISEGCQYEYGFCQDECRELFNFINNSNFEEDANYIVERCKVNSKGHIKTLTIGGYSDNNFQPLIDEISTHTDIQELKLSMMSLSTIDLSKLKSLTNIKYLEIYDYRYDSYLTEIPEIIFSLTSLKNLTITDQKITSVPDDITKLKNLEHIDLSNNKITKLPKKLSELPNLEYINFSYNDIYSDLPESYNNLTKLKEIYLLGNNNIKGKMITNDSLEKCYLSSEYDLCLVKEMKCMTYGYYSDDEDEQSLKMCDDSDDTEPESTDGKCGKGKGKCPTDQCCNKDGKCTTNEKQCLVSNGCQYGYGECTDDCEKIHGDKFGINDLYIRKCNIDSQGNVRTLYIDGYAISEEKDYQKLINEISKYTSIEDLKMEDLNYKNLNLDSLKNLKKLSKLNIIGYIDSNQLGTFPEVFTSLTSLKEIFISSNKLTSIPDSISNLTELESLALPNNDITSIPDSIESLKKLKKLDLSDNHISKFSNILPKLGNLEYLDLSYNDIYDVLPEELNNLTKLKTFNVQGNLNVKGKTLIIEGLETCYYSTYYNICMPKEIKCFDTYYYDDTDNIKLCSDENEISIENDECEQIYKYLVDHDIEDYRNHVYQCQVNGKGKVISISLNNIGVDGQKYIDNIAKLTELNELYLNNLNYGDLNLDPLKNLTKITKFYIDDYYDNPLKKIPDCVYSFKSLKELGVTYNKITSIPSKLSELKDLEILNLSTNEIDSDLPESLNSLSKLKKVFFTSNKNLRGKTLTNENLEYCSYEYGSEYDLCIAKDMDCLDDARYEPCSSSNDAASTKVSTDGRCGKEKGRCPTGECCSKYGWCGRSSDHCSADAGCQSTYGQCSKESDEISSNGRCGPLDGKCPEGECCSKYGWCGTSKDHCVVANGCQSEFGKCNSATETETVVSTNGKCGAKDGKCPEGECCSKDGTCGTSEDHCSVDSGCQIDFGKCTNNKITTSDQCGPQYGKCPEGKCCSKYGWCGTSEKYCAISNGCQSEFGECNGELKYVNGRCGEEYGKCPDGQCCSKYGWCGKDDRYCGTGCQSEFGDCY